MPQLYRSLDVVQLDNTWLTIGVYDGVHKGHQEIIHRLTAGAHTNGAPAVVLTFNPHPAFVLSGREIPCISTPEERAELLFGLGVDAVISMEFTLQLAEQSAEKFMLEVKRHLRLQQLLIGYDFSLGKNRVGNFERLSHIGQDLGYRVSMVEPISFNNELISSTLIRQAIAHGDVKQAAEKLGRYYSMTGLVISGDGRGRTIGIPTANVNIPKEKVLPRNGVYACWAVLPDNQKHPAVVNIGLRPTFTNGEVKPRVEAHLLDHTSDLYGQNLTLEFVDRLRDEQKFPSVDALITQVHTDIQTARGWLG
ncbi:MAG: bifunctional riboflavin kinase/FAD synthetase [Chloroflexota bacterium]